MLILTVSLLAATAALVSLFVVGVIYRRTKLAQPPSKKKVRTNKIEGNDNSGNQWKGKYLTYNAKSEPCSRELFYFAQAKDLQGTVTKLIERLQVQEELNKRLLDRNDQLEVLVAAYQLENNRLKEEARMLPLLDLHNSLPQVKKRKVQKEKAA